MDPVAILIGIILIALTIYLIGTPLLKKDEDEDFYDLELEQSLEGDRLKESVFSTLAEIEFDYQMGKLSKADYQELQQKYKEQAVGILKSEEASLKKDAGTAGLEEEIEAELEAELEKELAEIRRQAQARRKS